MISGLHHFELCVANGLRTLNQFTNRYGFRLVAKKETTHYKQWVVNSGLQKRVWPAFVISERKNQNSFRQPVPTNNDGTFFCCENNLHKQDSVFNVALEIADVEKCTRRVRDNGGSVIQEPSVISDASGLVEYSVVSSQCGNVIHTLINRKKFPSNLFLPNYIMQNTEDENSTQSSCDFFVEDIDHVSYVCNRGQSKELINWYSKVFGMKRIFVSKTETEDEGMVINDNVGLRLKAMKYWLCAESGVETNIANSETDQTSPFKFVFAESLYGNENGHVETFLKEHHGPGVQHIALSTSNIIKTVDKMTDAGVSFQYPPQCYYSQIDKAAEIQVCGENINELEKYGILLDNEADADSSTSENIKYLLQIFTKPIFNEKTFFFEVIQRKGANGFGAGNIVALAKSIEQQQKQEQANVKT